MYLNFKIMYLFSQGLFCRFRNREEHFMHFEVNFFLLKLLHIKTVATEPNVSDGLITTGPNVSGGLVALDLMCLMDRLHWT